MSASHSVAFEQCSHGLGNRLGHELATGAHLLRQHLAGELPHHGAQLGLDVERQPVVDAPDPTAVQQQMAPLAVTVVQKQVKGRDAPELSMIEAARPKG